ncbi:MAG: nitrile hydratase [Acidobacteriota bacterium]
MSQAMTRGEVQDLISKFATENPKYREALLKDPKGVIEKQLNTSLGNVNVKAVADTADTVHVVIPYAAPEGELSDADLEKVAGGKQDIQAECTALALGGAAAGNTVTQINL